MDIEAAISKELGFSEQETEIRGMSPRQAERTSQMLEGLKQAKRLLSYVTGADFAGREELERAIRVLRRRAKVRNQ